MFNYFSMEVRMNNFSKAVMMVLLGLSVGTDLSAMQTRARAKNKAVVEGNQKAQEQAKGHKQDPKDKTYRGLKAEIKAAEAKVAKLEAKKAAKDAKNVACHKRAWGYVTNASSVVGNAGYNLVNGTYNLVKSPFVKGYNYLKSDAKVAGKKKAAKNQVSKIETV